MFGFVLNLAAGILNMWFHDQMFNLIVGSANFFGAGISLMCWLSEPPRYRSGITEQV